MSMIVKIVKKRSLRDPNLLREDLEYWLSRPPEERISAVEVFRRQHYGSSERLRRVVKIVKLGES